MKLLRKMLAGLAALSLVACSGPALLNTLTLDDPGAKRADRNVAYGTAPRQELDIYVPKSGEGPFPVLVFVHGGSWKNGDKKDYSFTGHAFASKGYVTVLINYRMVPNVTFPAFVADTATALVWVRDNVARYDGDPSRIFVSGHSAGAYNAVAAVMDKALRSKVGLEPEDIAGVIGLSGPYDFYPFDVDATIDAFGNYTEPKATQPVNMATKNLPPFFLAHGLKDETVYPRNSRALATHLEKAGIPVTAIYYEDLNHAGSIMSISRTFRGKSTLYEDMLEFMEAPGAAGSEDIRAAP